MLYFRRSQFLRRLTLLLTLVVVPACYSYQTVGAGDQPPAVIPTTARLMLHDGSHLDLESSIVRGDSIIGMVRGSGAALPDRVAVHLADLAEITRKKFNTVLVVLPIAVLIWAVVGLGCNESRQSIDEAC